MANASDNPRILIEDNKVFLDENWLTSITLTQFFNRLSHANGFDMNGLIIPDGLRAIAQYNGLVFGVIEYPPGVYPVRVRDPDYENVKVFRVSMPYIAAFFMFSVFKNKSVIINRVAPMFSTRPLTEWDTMLYFPAFPNCSSCGIGMCGSETKPIGSTEPILIRVSQQVRDCIYNSNFNDDYASDSAYVMHYVRGTGLTFPWWARATETDPLLWSTYGWKRYQSLQTCFKQWTRDYYCEFDEPNGKGSGPLINLTTGDLARIVFNYAAQQKTKKGNHA